MQRIFKMTILIGNIKNAIALNNIAKKYSAKILVSDGRYEIDATSLVGIFSLNLTEELDIEIVSDNQDEIRTIVYQIKSLGIEI